MRNTGSGMGIAVVQTMAGARPILPLILLMRKPAHHEHSTVAAAK